MPNSDPQSAALPDCLSRFPPALAHSIHNAKALLFDCDGTLLDTMPTYFKSWTLTSEELNLPVMTPERFYGYAGLPVGVIFQNLIDEYNDTASKNGELNTTVTVARCEETKKIHHHNLVNTGEVWAEEIKCVTEIAKYYRSLTPPKPCAVCSSGWKDHVVGGLEAVGIDSLFSVVLTASDSDKVKNPKPAGDIWIEACRLLTIELGEAIEPSSCVGFEDAELGMKSLAVANVGCSVDVTRHYHYPRNVEQRERGSKA